MARSSTTKKKAPAPVTHTTSSKAKKNTPRKSRAGAKSISKAKETTPRKSRAGGNTTKPTAKATKGGSAATAHTKTKDSKGSQGDARCLSSGKDDDDDDDVRYECYPENDKKDVDYESSGGDSGSASEKWSENSDSNDGSSDESECAFDCDYGDTEETEGLYKIVMEVSIEDHGRFCGCDLDAEGSLHRLVAASAAHKSS